VSGSKLFYRDARYNGLQIIKTGARRSRTRGFFVMQTHACPAT
jgi:hypothetical protein